MTAFADSPHAAFVGRRSAFAEDFDRDFPEDDVIEDQWDQEDLDHEDLDQEDLDDEQWDEDAWSDDESDAGAPAAYLDDDGGYKVEDVDWAEAAGDDWDESAGGEWDVESNGWDDREALPVPESLAGYDDWQDAYELGVTYQDAVRTVLGPDGLTLSDGDVDALLAEVTAGMTPEEAENFFRSLGRAARSVGRTLVRAAPSVLPVVGGAVGTLIGGPAGTAIGGALGRVAGGAVGRLASRSPSRRRRGRGGAGRRGMRRGGGRPSATPPGASSAVAQLISLLQNPALQQALLGASLGGSGTVRIGEEQLGVPFGGMMNALECLAAEAAEEMHEFHAGSAQLPEYLVGDDGEAIDDFAQAETRAAHLLDILRRN